MKIFSMIGYHSSPYEIDKFENSTPENRAKTGEGAQKHGYGLYVQADKTINTERYKNRLSGIPLVNFGKGWINGKDLVMGIFYKKDPDEYYRIFTCWDIIANIWSDCRREGYSIGLLFQDGLDTFKVHMRHWVESNIESQKHKQLERGIPLEFIDEEIKKNYDSINLLQGIKMNKIYQYTVEFPDDMIFAEEGVEGKNQSDDIRRILGKELFKEYNSRSGVVTTLDLPFENILTELKPDVEEDSKEQTDYLMSIGIDGIHYNGGLDGECWVIFNCEKLKIIAKE